MAYLIQVSINHPNGNIDTLLVEGAENEHQARRAAYEAVYGEPMDDEERATDETIEEYTAVQDIRMILHKPLDNKKYEECCQWIQKHNRMPSGGAIMITSLRYISDLDAD